MENNHYRASTNALDRRDVIAALVIPADFADRLQSDRSTTLQILLEGSDANNANLALGYITGFESIHT